MTTSNGLLLIDKPQGVTSHDVVGHVRRVLNEQRVGHAGTLDPMATGLLILGVGPSTRLLRFAQDQVKHYEGVMTFGVRTDSLDADGAVVETAPVPMLTQASVDLAAETLFGDQEQIPPMVSAVKVNGRRLHALAREGLVVDRRPRSITVFALTLAPLDETRWSFDVTCSVGTYVRVLMSDLAQRLATIGHLSALRRLSSGTHHVRDALTYYELDDRVSQDASVLLAPRCFVDHLATVEVSDDQERRLRMGQRLTFDQPEGEEIAALSNAGNLVAVLRRRGEVWQPVVVLPGIDARFD
ncbi:MAG: tRNA pseudouridine(55) synthase TruB [Acidimicrobiales bacterium]